MKTNRIQLTDRGLRELTGLMHLSGRWFLPEPSGDVRELTAAREEWETGGLMLQSLDGSYQPQAPLDGMLYHLRNAVGAIRMGQEDATEIFVFSRISCLWISRKSPEERWQLRLRPVSGAMFQIDRDCRENGGRLASLRGDSLLETDLIGLDADALRQQILTHQNRIYAREESHA